MLYNSYAIYLGESFVRLLNRSTTELPLSHQWRSSQVHLNFIVDISHNSKLSHWRTRLRMRWVDPTVCSRSSFRERFSSAIGALEPTPRGPTARVRLLSHQAAARCAVFVHERRGGAFAGDETQKRLLPCRYRWMHKCSEPNLC